ncbi:hypothetical protein [Micromonospora sp. NPDC093277]|uniref:hypothetical protein n=1 Tax=Micromonospora sp. NPDC093277 TaxID=3364291 RepID=UPI00381E1BDA
MAAFATAPELDESRFCRDLDTAIEQDSSALRRSMTWGCSASGTEEISGCAA